MVVAFSLAPLFTRGGGLLTKMCFLTLSKSAYGILFDNELYYNHYITFVYVGKKLRVMISYVKRNKTFLYTQSKRKESVMAVTEFLSPHLPFESSVNARKPKLRRLAAGLKVSCFLNVFTVPLCIHYLKFITGLIVCLVKNFY